MAEYSEVNSKHGLVGLFKHRNKMAKDLYSFDNIIRFNNLDKKQRGKITDSKYLGTLKNLKIFREIFSAVKITVEMYEFLKSIVSFIASAALIPFVVLSVYIFFKRLFAFMSIFYTSTLISIYLSSHYTAFNTFTNNLSGMKELMRVFLLRSYNFIFNENVPLYKSRMEVIYDKIQSHTTHNDSY